MQISLDPNIRRMRRSNRGPNFPVAGVMKPYGLYPFYAHPVLPGETCQSITSRLTVVGQPVKNPLSGAWLEAWYFYVKLTDIDKDLGQAFLNDGESSAAYLAGSDMVRFFTKSGQINWIKMCYDKIIEAHFTDEGHTVPTIDTVSMMQLNNRSWYNNLIFEPADVAVDVTDARQTYEALNQWQMLQQMQMTELTYEDYLETYGVKPSITTQGEPEILRYHRKWSRPTNVINPADGSPASSYYYSEDIKLDKAKRFIEPGFIIGVIGVRPKMFQSSIRHSSLIGELWGFTDWYPSYTLDDPTAAVRELESSARDRLFESGKHTASSTAAMIYDHRDLLTHGEQFINAADTDLPYPLPMSSGLDVSDGGDSLDTKGIYPTSTDVDNLFVGTAVNEKFIAYEGMVSCTVTGHVKDQIK